MPDWGDVLSELDDSRATNNGNPDFDGIRRRYIAELNQLTGRDTVVYASNWLSPISDSRSTGIVLQDMQGLMEVFRGLKGPSLDLILHSPGGSPEAAHALVHYMRSKFTDVRVFIPLAAMSAATMWALAADRIVMGKHSQLGPIDPQVAIAGSFVPTSALVRQFERAQRECAENPANLSSWLPTLQQYSPGLLEVCKDYETLGKSLVQDWLSTYMFNGQPNGKEISAELAEFFADSSNHLSHARGLNREELTARGLVVENLEEDQSVQDAVLSVHHAFMHTLTTTNTPKIIENHHGRAYIVTAPQVVQMPGIVDLRDPRQVQIPN